MPDWLYVAMFAPWLPAAVGVWIERWRESRQWEAVSSRIFRGPMMPPQATPNTLSQDDLMTKGVELSIDGHKWVTQAVNMSADCDDLPRMELQMIRLD